ncbi:MAG: transketolase [Rubrimonas sp.]
MTRNIDRPVADDDALLAQIERRILWLACWTIHHANHLRAQEDGAVKVGGHQASSASMASIMTALYLSALRPEDRVAVKPHAAPIFHALQYLAGRLPLQKLRDFRAFGGAQSYPSRTKDVDDVDFSTGSVGLGVAQTLFASLAQDYVRAHGWGLDRPPGRMVALMGDAEMDEGNIHEALFEGWKHDVRNLWWVVDYNRQSLDGVVREGLWEKFEALFRGFGWDVAIVKHGRLQQAAFAEPGGEALRAWIDACPNDLYAALTFRGGAAWRRRLTDDLDDQGPVSALLARRDDAELAALMANLGGHDIGALRTAFDAAAAHDRPTLFLCYTIKGWGLPLAGHKDNHAGLMTPAQIETFARTMGVRPGREWEPWEGVANAQALQRRLHAAPFFAAGPRRLSAPAIAAPPTLDAAAPRGKPIATQTGFGQILHEIARTGGELADRIVTVSPDVTVSTNLGPWVNRRGVFARRAAADLFRAERIPSSYRWDIGPAGQHVELGIAEANLFLMLSALGLSHGINGQRLLPVGTVYDPFVLRGADQLNYACYQDARFMIAGTPSGVTLAPEGGAHQSIATPLVGMAQDGLAAFEPAFVDELAAVMAWGFDYMQRDGDAAPDRRSWLRDATGGSIYLRLSTRPVEQPLRDMTPDLARSIVDGGYWMRRPGPNAEIVVAYAGALAPEAIAAVGMLGGRFRDVGLLAVTSADRLHAGWSAAQAARATGTDATAHVERLLAEVPRHAALVTVMDGHPATLAWLGGVTGLRTRALGVEHFGQSGSIAEIHAHFGLDAASIAAAAAALARPVRRDPQPG